MFFLLIAVGGGQTTAGLESYLKAREVLDAGIEAMGGMDALRSLKTVRRELSGDWFGSGQNQRPFRVTAPTFETPPSNGQNQITSFIDYEQNRWLDLAQESDFTGDSISRATAVAGDQGFETLTYRAEKPFYHAFSAGDLPPLRVRKLRRYPEGLLRMAADRPETLEHLSDGVISFADAMGTRVLLYFDPRTKLISKSETLRSHPVAGDTVTEIFYQDYRPVGRLKLPFHTIERVAGVPYEELRASTIELNTPLPEERFKAPRDFASVVDDPAVPFVERAGEGLYMIRGPYNSIFAVFRDHVMVFEAPISSRYSEDCLKLIRATAPGKPIRYLVSTHFHFDHIAGVRTYIAEGISIVTTPDAKDVIEQVAAAKHTLHPDALSMNPKAPRIETVSDKRVFDDGTNRVELYDFGPTDHVAQMLAVYFPKERLLFEADVWDIISTDLAIAGSDTVQMSKKIRELGLKVERVIPVHGAPGASNLLERALAVQAAAQVPREHFDNASVLYDWVTNSRGDRLRTFVTKPRGAKGKVPAIFFAGWLSCDSVEYAKGETDGFGAFMRRIIEQSGYATVRMDKPGVGESQGTRCEQSDFQGELEGYRSAFDSMRKYDFIDMDRVFVVGISNGGGVTPLVSGQHPVRGFVAAVSWGRTWYEHMLELERRRLTADGKSPGDIHAALQAFAQFYDDYLIRRMTPGQILKQHPEWKSLWYDSADGQYGRPAAFYQQLQDLNLGRLWENVAAPVLVIGGSDDSIMSRADSEAIADNVNRAHPGRARYLEIERMTHGFTVDKKFHGDLAPMVLIWMKEQLAAGR